MATPQAKATTSPVEKGFQESLRKFKARLSKREQDSFKLTTLGDLRQAVLQIQNKQAARSESMNLPRVLGFLEGFKQFGQVVEVFSNSSEFLAFIWGPMKFLLQVACNFTEAFDTLLDAYQRIGESIPLVEQYRALFTGNSHMDDALAKIYDDILEFHRRALRFFNLPTWRQIFRSVWKDFSSRFEHILQDLRRHKDLIESQATALHFQQYQVDRQMFFEKLNHLETAERKRKYSEVLQWFSGADALLDHEDICKVRQEFPDSGGWLLKQPDYSSWKEDSVPRVSTLWLSGIPGAGKTVLASFVTENCKEDVNASTAFFYCKYDDPQRNTSVAVLRTLLSQLLKYDHDLLPWCYDLYLNSGQLSLSSGDLCKEILKAVLTNGDKTFVVVDGIDECDKKEARLLINVLSDMVTVCDSQHPGKLRVMVVSQDEPDIRRNLSTFSELSLKVIDNEGDIHRFVDVWCGKIQSKFKLEEGERNYIFESTCHRAHGMFLFVKLIMINLYDQVCLMDLREQIRPDKFPPGLKEAYERIVDRINHRPPTELSIARKVLRLMTCARRPLKWHEIQGALSISTQDLSVDFVERKPRIHIRDICGPLINQLAGDRLELVHSSAKGYLIESMFVQPSITECYFSALCLHYLTFEDFDIDRTEAARRDSLLDGCFAFQDYAITHWSDHLSSVIKGGPQSAFSQVEDDLSSALTDFVAKYQLFEQESQEKEKISGGCDQFQEFAFFDDLYYSFRHIEQQKAKGFDGLDEISPRPLDKVIAANRALLEEFAASKALQPETRNDLLSFYGPNWYKCSKASCFYFHEGFEDEKARKSHIARHEKPFRCSFQECETGHKLGFTKQKDLEKHMSIYHPESGKAVATFSRLRKALPRDDTSDGRSPSRGKHPATHACDLCPKRFTRASNLRSHQLSHKNEKPFACGVCETTFVRKSDRERHQNTHSGEKKFVCKGDRRQGMPRTTWGCGKGFPRADALASHLRSKAGQTCLKPLFEEERLELQRKLLIEQRKAEGLELPVPHPEFELIDWHQLLENTEDTEELTPNGD